MANFLGKSIRNCFGIKIMRFNAPERGWRSNKYLGRDQNNNVVVVVEELTESG